VRPLDHRDGGDDQQRSEQGMKSKTDRTVGDGTSERSEGRLRVI
jgi:hypothetical protein